MPQIQRAAVSGCCVGAYYYDLGGAHNKYRSKNIEEFAMRIAEIGYNQINTASTNASQGTERKFLEQLGFKEVFKSGGMHVHAVDSATLEKHLKPHKEALAARKKAEAEAKRKAEEERQKKIKEQQEKERLAKAEADRKALEKLKDFRITSNEDVNITWVRKFYNEYKGISISVLFNTAFGFKAFPEYERGYDDDHILRSVNSRLRKRREVAKEKAAEEKKATKKVK
jgi:hypothetical protein